MTCVIICGGEITDYEYISMYLAEASLVISADSGARHCERLQVTPDILVGDFDSILSKDYNDMVKAGAEIARFPAEKDMTDSELAVEIALSRGCKRIILLGAIGSRLDHSISNIFLLKKITDQNVEGLLANEKNEIRLVKECLELERDEWPFVTLLPFAGDAVGVTIKGFYYPLVNATLKTGSTWGVSNIITEPKAQIDVREGYLLVIKSRD
ncbi:MAG: thiamine diphosphokinase [Bacillota bacterium]